MNSPASECHFRTCREWAQTAVWVRTVPSVWLCCPWHVRATTVALMGLYEGLSIHTRKVEQ